MTIPLFKAIIFDLGNVVFEYDMSLCLFEWGKIFGVHPEELQRRFVASSEIELFQKGKMSPRAMMQHISTMLGIDLSLDTFVQGWNAIFLDEVPGTAELVARLGKTYRVVALSNTNVLHAARMEKLYSSTFRRFEKIFYSHVIGFRKPEEGAYSTVTTYLGCESSEVILLDDEPEYVQAACRLGISGIVVDSPDQMLRELQSLGVIW